MIQDQLLPEFYDQFLKNNPILTKEKEIELSNIVLNGDEKSKNRAINTLVESNLKLAIRIVMREYSWFKDKNDLISEASIGLFKAASRYDASIGAKFSTYAVWYIRQNIQEYIEKSSIVHMSSGANELYLKLKSVIGLISEELGYEPVIKEVSEILGIKENKLENILKYKYSYVPLDSPCGMDDDGKTYSEMIEDENAVMPDDAAQYACDANEANTYFSELKPREEFVLKKRFGFDNGEPMILQDIGDILKITRERTRQIQEEAMRKIRKNILTKQKKNARMLAVK